MERIVFGVYQYSCYGHGLIKLFSEKHQADAYADEANAHTAKLAGLSIEIIRKGIETQGADEFVFTVDELTDGDFLLYGVTELEVW